MTVLSTEMCQSSNSDRCKFESTNHTFLGNVHTHCCCVVHVVFQTYPQGRAQPIPKFPHYRQLDMMSCGPTCLRIIAQHYGRTISQTQIEQATHKGKTGVSLLHICTAAEELGLRTMPVMANYESLLERPKQPFIAHWRQEHFLVVYEVTPKFVRVSDPAASQLMTLSREDFCAQWESQIVDGEGHGIGVYFETTPDFFETEDDQGKNESLFHLAKSYLEPHKALIWQVVFSLLAGGALALFLPFLTQSLVDFGVNRQDLGYITLMTAGMAVIYVSQVLNELLRGWLLLYVSARINISLIADFLARLMRSTIPYIESKNIGDLMERLNDHDKIQSFLTTQAFTVLFGLFNLIIYSIVMAIYDASIFAVFAFGSIIYFGWAIIFMKARRKIDYRRFNQMSAAQSSQVEIIQGVAEIKLAGAETRMRWGWERIQARLFKINLDGLKLEQWQMSGATLINNFVTLIVTLLAARGVVMGELTLGQMLAISMILGQLNGPITQFLGILQNAQDAKISLERAIEVRSAPAEDFDNQIDLIPDGDLVLSNVCFRYGDQTAPFVLDDISFTIPNGKTTAIVGGSGSGKTTLLKLLLKFYDAERGDIRVGSTKLSALNSRTWRTNCGAVLQDGMHFTDTIAQNIALGDDNIDRERLLFAAQASAAHDFIESLPLGYNTKIGADGGALSGGQRQRLLLARAIYKQPKLFLFDEATSALDAISERQIVTNVETMLSGITKVIVAHRLSTVKDADQIIVLDSGRIAEKGTHTSLIESRGKYYSLIKNQLELGT